MIIQNTTAILDSNLKNKEVGSGKWPEHNNQICDNLHQDHFIQESVRYAGNHLIVDFWGASKLDCLETMEVAMREAVEKAKATLLHIHLHHFTPNGGISGVAVLAESHISVHTWPEYGFAAFDIFMCGDSKPNKAIEVLESYFKPKTNNVSKFRRGEVVEVVN
ncbi:adenosylmethionine decarboxylase [Francisella tularensis]|uniref:adenosylmethionine decarboxylase n=1 Tax=Francisella tularensis TaxID=263 RepID=UPI0000F593F9|nr:adenosylmethionine decarboxylase [Francisella tularensis]ABO47336.1 S-adenosylmethionine decarboxylase [Francisella tularensis subsp. tularensis WY96-3418]AJI62777.1 S-adenosylmethionine decarboxylase proenzyme [Francisella tularensis subsp. tularensis]AKH92497.1 S-adenosylmethionine decarboxylase [Francisella tularensis subsp. tularensis WY-00W4114]AKU73287.1 S-adenosylmethionine decarboxylase proenzyme [Francisella tularensis subsp. tularensis]EKM85230.1 S-adenosylmethionine decarboxylase